ncbi:MAG: alkane 1-monooxygenase [Cyclobacteriaceae bacterium]|nr:alkane 1-monooxygenase [Cyclobacteriaceae bacterium]
MKKGTYLLVYALPISVVASFSLEGIYTYLPIFLFYLLLPLVELVFKPDYQNSSEIQSRNSASYFDWVLYMAVPVQLTVLFYFFYIVSTQSFAPFEYVGLTLSMGLMCGVFGINIAHELGHRNSWYEQLMAEILLLTSLEMHFIPYHNNGHHHNVATPQDPATARKGEPVFLFWFRSQVGSYFKAWSLENKRLRKLDKRVFSFKHKVLFYTLIQLSFITGIFFMYGGLVAVLFVAASAFGIMLLETVNYIEHYGLLRNKNEHGRYERVQHHHSWNSDHKLGRAMLFELSRHSDHHYKASKKYQTLLSLPESPQMPTGYPGMMLFSLVPPLWFWVMNKRLESISVL